MFLPACLPGCFKHVPFQSGFLENPVKWDSSMVRGGCPRKHPREQGWGEMMTHFEHRHPKQQLILRLSKTPTRKLNCPYT